MQQHPSATPSTVISSSINNISILSLNNLSCSSSRDATTAALSNSSSSSLETAIPKSFPGYPASWGLLSPALAPLLSAIQEQHLYSDSKTAV
jgi:hypothetical protein